MKKGPQRKMLGKKVSKTSNQNWATPASNKGFCFKQEKFLALDREDGDFATQSNVSNISTQSVSLGFTSLL